MAYTGLLFIIFISIVATCYFLMPRKYRWMVLLAGSAFFYVYAVRFYSLFIVFTIVSTYLAALKIAQIDQTGLEILKANKTVWGRSEKKVYKEKLKNSKKRYLIAVLVANFGILGVLKYVNAFLIGISTAFALPSLNLGLLLPLGISFYTFQTMGYLVDVFRGKIEPEKNIFKLALFVSFFPQIIQGPISMYDQLAYQLYEPHDFSFERFKKGVWLMMWGYFKKLVIADRAVTVITHVTGDVYSYSGSMLLLVVVLYALQLYTDFSGGIDISRGFAQIIGIDMAENFRRPYFSTSINDYWRRWHITLGAWMKNYIFYPLAMSKSFMNMSKKIRKAGEGRPTSVFLAKAFPTALASLITFLVVGIWHGANTKYIGFGLWNGGVIMFSVLMKPQFDRWIRFFKINRHSFGYRIFCIFRTLLIVLVGYIFDLAPSIKGAFDMMYRMVAQFDFNALLIHNQMKDLGYVRADYYLLIICTLFILTVSVIQERHPRVMLRDYFVKKHWMTQAVWTMVFFMIIVIFGKYGPGCSANEFVYMQF